MFRIDRPLIAVLAGAALLTACGATAASPSPSVPSTPVATPSIPTATSTATAAATAPAVVDGRIAFVWSARGSDATNIASVAADGSDYRKLTSSATDISEGVEWLPGSDRLMFDGSRKGGKIHLYTIGPFGDDERQVTSGDQFEGYPSVSPDGSAIAIDLSSATGDLGITILDGDGKNPRRVTTPPVGAIDGLPAFSPDGSRIAFQRTLDATPGHGRSAIFVINVDGTHPVQLTEWDTNASYANWSPDGSRIVFNDNSEEADAATALNLWLMDDDGSNKAQLTNSAVGTWAFGADWSPSGNKIVYVMGTQTTNALSVINPDGSDSVAIWTAPTGQRIDDPDWGPTK